MIEIVDASADGVPLQAICTICHPDPAAVWNRPADDPSGHSLHEWVRLHHRNRRYL